MRADGATRAARVVYVNAALALAAVGAAGCDRPDARDPASGSAAATGVAIAVGAPVPRYTVATLAGDSVTVGVAGAPLTLMNVWATWCTSCREEMADLDTLHQRYAGRGLRVVAVSIDAGPTARVQRFAAGQRLSMAVAHDAEARIQSAFHVTGVPSTYLVDRDGRLRWMQVGGIHGSAQAARAAVEQTLAGDMSSAAGR